MDDQVVGCICEGNAEHAILDILLENDYLIFRKQDLINSNDLRLRNARDFEARYLRESFPDKVQIYLILDSHTQEFKLSKGYRHKAEVHKVVTAPEIEMLLILDQGLYDKFQKVKSSMKPSAFCKNRMSIGYRKSYQFVYGYFSSDPRRLLKAIQEYARRTAVQKDELTLEDLLRPEYRH